MKRLLLICLLTAAGLTAGARGAVPSAGVVAAAESDDATALKQGKIDEALLARIEGRAPASFTGKVDHTKPGRKDWAMRTGRIYFTAPERFAMRFDDGDCLVFSDNRFYNVGSAGTFNLSSARGPVAKLKNSLMGCLSGRLREVASLQNGVIEMTDGGDRHVVSLTTRNRLKSGYKTIVISYLKSDLTPVELSITDFLGRTDHYAIRDYREGEKGEDAVFFIPNKQ